MGADSFLRAGTVLGETTVANNSTATVTLAATAGRRYSIDWIMISAGGAPSAAVTALIQEAGATLQTIQVPASAFTPLVIPFKHETLPGVSFAATCPAIGGTTPCTVTIFGRLA